jgi:hypothetical protein
MLILITMDNFGTTNKQKGSNLMEDVTKKNIKEKKTLFQRFFHLPSDAELWELAQKKADTTISFIKGAMNKPIMCHIVMAEGKKHEILSDNAIHKLDKISDMLLNNNSEIKSITNFDSPKLVGSFKQ